MINKVLNAFNAFPIVFIAGLFMIFSGVCASLTAAFVRLASQEMHPFQIAFFRTVLVVPLIAPIIIKNNLSVIRTNYPFLTFIRGIVGRGAMLFFFYGISLTELSKAQALAFTIPIFATLLAIIFFNELVGFRRWSAMIIGFIGALIVLRPDLNISIGPVFVIIACILWSISVLLAKKLTETDTNLSITFWQSVGIIPLSFLASIFVWQWINLYQFLLLLLITLVGTLAQLSLNSALKRGKISFVLPLDYLRLIWAVTLGYIMFGEIPLQTVWVGGTIIVVATTYIGIRENYILNKNRISTHNNLYHH